jgi:hypothetical protein
MKKIFMLIVIALITAIIAVVAINIVLEIQNKRQMELDEDLMIKTVDENSEYYIKFAQEFYDVYKKAESESGFLPGKFSLKSAVDIMETPKNDDLIGYWAHISHADIDGKDVWYVEMFLPYGIEEFEYWFGYSRIYQQMYSVIYITEDGIKDSDLSAITGYLNIPEYRNGRLFIKRVLENRWPT